MKKVQNRRASRLGRLLHVIVMRGIRQTSGIVREARNKGDIRRSGWNGAARDD